MAVIRQANLLGQGRLDVPHLRAIESAVVADFDLLAGQIITGGEPVVVHGFDLIPLSPGAAATSLQIHVAGGVLMHPLASEAGTIFSVPASRAPETLNVANTRLSGSFTASTTNYIGVDLHRTADPTTADLVQFLDPNTNLEKPKTVPLARTLDYAFTISTQDFSTTPGIAPLAKVVTDAFNNIVSVEDARNFMFRLGSGGAITDPLHAYLWASGRTEAGDNSDFNVADKAIASLKEWLDAAMTRLWELGGGEHWYSPTADRNVRMVRAGAVFDDGEYFEWDGTNLHWQGLSFVFDNSTGNFNQVLDQTVDSPGLTDLADGDCVYVDLDRSQNLSGGSSLQPVKTAMTTLGTPVVPGSRYIIAWRVGSTIYTRDSSFPVGATFFPATPTALGIVKLDHTSFAPSGPFVAVTDASHNVEAAGLKRGSVLGAGTLTIGAGAEDTNITVQAGTTLQLTGSANVFIDANNFNASVGGARINADNDILLANNTGARTGYTGAGGTFDITEFQRTTIDEGSQEAVAKVDNWGLVATQMLSARQLGVQLEIAERYTDPVNDPWTTPQPSAGWGTGVVTVSDTGDDFFAGAGTDFQYFRTALAGPLVIRIITGGGYGPAAFSAYSRASYTGAETDGIASGWVQISGPTAIPSGAPITIAQGLTVTFSNDTYVQDEIMVFDHNKYQPLFTVTKPYTFTHTRVYNRFNVDHQGYATGRIDKVDLQWRATGAGVAGSYVALAAIAAQGLLYNNTGGGTVWDMTSHDPTAVHQSTWIFLTPHAEGGFDSIFMDAYQFFPQTTTAFAIEFELIHNTPADTHAKFYIGLTDAADGNYLTASKSAMAIVKSTALGNNNWWWRSADDTTASTGDTGYVPDGTHPDRFRIEYEGSACESGVALVRFFVNGQCVHVETTHVPVSAMKFSMGGHSDSSAPCVIYVSPINMTWNRFESCTI